MPTEKTTERWAEYETAGDVNRYIAQLEKQVAALTAELNELKVTYQLMSDAGLRALRKWKAAHPEQDMWPDQAANMVWLMEHCDALTNENDLLRVENTELCHQMVVDDDCAAALAACAAFRAWLREPPALIPGGSLVEVARLVDAALAAKP